jgi:hypothetical protein
MPGLSPDSRKRYRCGTERLPPSTDDGPVRRRRSSDNPNGLRRRPARNWSPTVLAPFAACCWTAGQLGCRHRHTDGNRRRSCCRRRRLAAAARKPPRRVADRSEMCAVADVEILEARQTTTANYVPAAHQVGATAPAAAAAAAAAGSGRRTVTLCRSSGWRWTS